VCVCVRVYVRVLCTCVYVCVRVFACVHVKMCVFRGHAFVNVCECTCTYVCVCLRASEHYITSAHIYHSLPPSMMMSPGSMCCISSSIVWSTGAPALTKMMTRLFSVHHVKPSEC